MYFGIVYRANQNTEYGPPFRDYDSGDLRWGLRICIFEICSIYIDVNSSGISHFENDKMVKTMWEYSIRVFPGQILLESSPGQKTGMFILLSLDIILSPFFMSCQSSTQLSRPFQVYFFKITFTCLIPVMPRFYISLLVLYSFIQQALYIIHGYIHSFFNYRINYTAGEVKLNVLWILCWIWNDL